MTDQQPTSPSVDGETLGEEAQRLCKAYENFLVENIRAWDEFCRRNRSEIANALSRSEAPVAWRYRFVTSVDGKDFSDWFVVNDPQSIPARDDQIVQPLYAAPSPDTRVREALEALRPFARAAKQIPDDLPDDLWTSCSSYEYDMGEESFEQLKASGVPLLSRKVKLQLWIDGHSLSDFRRAGKAYAALATLPQPGAVERTMATAIQEQIAAGDGIWTTCTGCYEGEDGQNVHGYPHSKVFGCTIGGGCGECGGIGAIWDTTDYGKMADDLDAGMIAPPPALDPVTVEACAKVADKWASDITKAGDQFDKGGDIYAHANVCEGVAAAIRALAGKDGA